MIELTGGCVAAALGLSVSELYRHIIEMVGHSVHLVIGGASFRFAAFTNLPVGMPRTAAASDDVANASAVAEGRCSSYYADAATVVLSGFLASAVDLGFRQKGHGAELKSSPRGELPATHYTLKASTSDVMTMSLEKIVSGGQTGADRAAFDVALERGILVSGWCPKGRLAEDGTIPARYPLQETASADSSVRTRLNVADAAATIIFDPPATKLSPGTELTIRVAAQLNKPHVVLTGFPNVAADAARVRSFLGQHRPCILNVAGPRESEAPGMYAYVKEVLRAALR